MLQDGILVAVLGQHPPVEIPARLSREPCIGETRIKLEGILPHRAAMVPGLRSGRRTGGSRYVHGQRTVATGGQADRSRQDGHRGRPRLLLRRSLLRRMRGSENGQYHLEERRPHRKMPAGDRMEHHLHDHGTCGGLGLAGGLPDQLLQGWSLPGVCRKRRACSLDHRTRTHQREGISVFALCRIQS